ncbi:MAG: orotidine-5'-phosphate decarboxylase [Gammaproteobacteria bacterium TMED119]|nr:MAG: orotidine-5'-phosphate decarboxylase [Gammaproteobacteria bacterium TMED119]RCL46282.1 MAG: orotidine-5'-phosphate decarboxylase [Candidatus Thioglobus sp.]|tara:strand:+ start:839 stop:1525 length:687 start_codon:yes stop_codon:yes gene_type:complete
MIIVALDFPDADQALAFADTIPCADCAVKVGFELFLSAGPELVTALVERGFKVFLDLKFHDIPNTVAQACLAAAKLGVWMINVHAAGGIGMMQAARAALDGASHRPHLIAVTVLTSMDKDALQAVGVQGDMQSVVTRWATQAMQAGCDGVVSSAQEAQLIRQHTSADFLLVTPGIRLPTDARDDQKRIVTPQQAAQLGVNHIVVGRPITQAHNPQLALQTFVAAFARA